MVAAAWVDQGTDREVRDLDSGWAVVVDQAARELVVAAEPAGAVALARQGVAAGARVCGSRPDRAVAARAAEGQEPAVAAARGQESVVRAEEAAQVAVDTAVAEGQEPAVAAARGQEPVVRAEEAAQVAVDTAVAVGQESAAVVARAQAPVVTVGEAEQAVVAEGPESAGAVEWQLRERKAPRRENG